MCVCVCVCVCVCLCVCVCVCVCVADTSVVVNVPFCLTFFIFCSCCSALGRQSFVIAVFPGLLLHSFLTH